MDKKKEESEGEEMKDLRNGCQTMDKEEVEEEPGETKTFLTANITEVGQICIDWPSVAFIYSNVCRW